MEPSNKNFAIKIGWALSIIASIAFVACLSGCKSSTVGCSQRQERQAEKHFYKGFRKCQTAMARETNIWFPFRETRDTVTEFIEAEPIVIQDTVVQYLNDTVVFHITKTVNRLSTKTITATITKEDQRKLLLKDEEIKKLEQSLTKSEKQSAKDQAAKVIYRGILLLVLALSAVVFGIKFIIPKVLKTL